MRFAGTCAAVASGALVTLVIAMQPLSQASGSVEQKGLWSKSFSAGQSPEDCGVFKLDDNGFYLSDDPRNGVELGVKFQASQESLITGVRIHRYDNATVTASLWNSDGSRLAVGDFAPSAGIGWQDMSFADPVTIEPGQHLHRFLLHPPTKYAFTHEYFAESG